MFSHLILRFTSGVTPTDFLEVSMAAEPFLIQVLADKSTSIGGGLGLEPTTVRAAYSKHSAVSHSVTGDKIIKAILTLFAWQTHIRNSRNNFMINDWSIHLHCGSFTMPKKVCKNVDKSRHPTKNF